MKTLKGNLLDLAEQGHFDIIAHGCNCFCTMKSGIAGEIARRYPEVVEVDALTEKGDCTKLGSCTDTWVTAEKYNFKVFNLYTQYRYGRNTSVRYVCYHAIRRCFSAMAHELKCSKQEHLRIGIPKIGAGLANGDWGVISKIIQEEMQGFDVTVVEFNNE